MGECCSCCGVFRTDIPCRDFFCRYTLQRRLRIYTVPMLVAQAPLELYLATDADAVLCVLMHKIVKASEEEGLVESCALLQDWLILFTAQYNRHMTKKADLLSSQVRRPDLPYSHLDLDASNHKDYEFHILFY